MEQGPALDELLGMKTNPEREAQASPVGSNRDPPLVQQGRRGYHHHRQKSPMVRAWLHAGRVMFLRKLGREAVPKVIRREYRREQGA